MTTTFDVASVSLGKPLKQYEFHPGVFTLDEDAGVIEAGDCTSPSLISAADVGNHFYNAISQAYNKHYPLILSPDHVWLVLAQGFSNHVNANSESLRNKFVKHQGKKEIVILTQGVKGDGSKTPWANKLNSEDSILEKFTKALRKELGDDMYTVFMSEFSTTGSIERAANAVLMMDTFKSYFDYTCMTLCGIPQITLEGTSEDWKQLRARANQFAKYDCQWWLDALDPILAQFEAASQGQIDKDFWQQIYKFDGGSGGPYISGWVVTLIPYIKHYKGGAVRNHLLTNWKEGGFGRGLHPGDFPSSLAVVPFKWNYYGTEHKMQFIAGIVGCSQHPETLAIRPEVGWAVREIEE